MSNGRPVLAEHRVVQRQQDGSFVYPTRIVKIEGIKHGALNIPIVITPLLLAQHVPVVFAPLANTSLLLASAVEESALPVEVILNVLLQFNRVISYRLNGLFVPRGLVLFLQLFFCLFHFFCFKSGLI